MTFAESLLLICLAAAIYYALRPLQRWAERVVLRILGRHPKWIETIIVPHEEN